MMNIEFLFNALTSVWAVGEILLALLTQTRQGEGKIQDRGSQIILLVVIIASLRIDDWMHSFFPADMPGSDSWLRPAAFGISSSVWEFARQQSLRWAEPSAQM